ncbi:hypothetical protein [Sphingomonas hankyongi]|uniref:Uncharacterized protein n=1 Tax=Sphingomonas hankyongi TaxID=2908209 RepID=A0ABT0S557_9SPHN|nr:hypothetical protein [Sphingomonas hankyongi]MCL6730700.1 hypothetical protein [Sphingomonas hankyongi]
MITSFLLLAAQAVPPPSVMAKSDDDKVRCQVEYQVHSRIPTQICRTKAQWQRIERDAEADMRDSKNYRASGRLGTIVDDGEGYVVAPKPPR